ncbi:MAG: hypothetical protein FWG74_05945 [Planctomycetes bacterium]|nr:hypothetical protein [Planctomycetota bacterium]
MLNGYCDIVKWVEQENKFELSYIHRYDELKNVTFDYALIAYAGQKFIDKAIAYLKELGVAEDKIILGGQNE